ncbi:putative colanic acid biosysnthesis UDP-glucose lipid carrier transferase [Cyclobacterium xiamenense]|uniref:Putative colanic acid biosysnthesis UDP-glucose lipid carrier transferase n=1 Tax=Cyclobacterium xiamenense TaxID=1297121 RepID=A0A1H6WP09_9BACT|nr:exopolysaccharide biosynthesis polyprenyl glycosylphosphotransferase [Cyclobacterium xiamenense]SEJ18618.1 putative colanic acid biosysnthesis UDP-glucose lipid carrier transferase [Cyclobacterium xiamenense]
MAKRFYRYFPFLFVAAELIVLWITLGLITFLLAERTESTLPSALWEFGLFGLVWVLVLLFRKDYKIGRTSHYWDTLNQFFLSFAWGLLVFFLLREQLAVGYGKAFGFYVYPLSLSFLAFFRVSVHAALRRYRRSGRNYLKAVILGRDQLSIRLAHTLQTNKALGIKFLGFYDTKWGGEESLGDVAHFFLPEATEALDLVYLSQEISPELVRKIVAHADENHIKVKIIPGPHLQWNKEMSFSRYGSFLVVNVNEIPLDRLMNRVFKRVFDLVFSLIVLVSVLSWLIPLVAVLIRWESKGPVFFLQKRTGLNNREFYCIKFRTMLDNPWADTLQATRNDPRVTRVGRFLRRFSLDELPQFFNVVKGDMSVVGPRPHTVPMNQEFKKRLDYYDNRHRIKPGITGLAQVLGYRGEIANLWQIRSRVRLDHFYIRNWSFFLDVRIVYKTMGELIARRDEIY